MRNNAIRDRVLQHYGYKTGIRARDQFRFIPFDAVLAPDDPARPGNVYLGTDYLGRIERRDNNLVLILDRRGFRRTEIILPKSTTRSSKGVSQ